MQGRRAVRSFDFGPSLTLIFFEIARGWGRFQRASVNFVKMLPEKVGGGILHKKKHRKKKKSPDTKL